MLLVRGDDGAGRPHQARFPVDAVPENGTKKGSCFDTLPGPIGEFQNRRSKQGIEPGTRPEPLDETHHISRRPALPGYLRFEAGSEGGNQVPTEALLDGVAGRSEGGRVRRELDVEDDARVGGDVPTDHFPGEHQRHRELRTGTRSESFRLSTTTPSLKPEHRLPGERPLGPRFH